MCTATIVQAEAEVIVVYIFFRSQKFGNGDSSPVGTRNGVPKRTNREGNCETTVLHKLAG
jgi:hypothetical protein